MHGTLIQDVKMSIDYIRTQDKNVVVQGWCFGISDPIEKLRVRQGGIIYEGQYGDERPDVGEHYNMVLPLTEEDIPLAKGIKENYVNSGFSITVPPQKFESKDEIVLEILRKNKWIKVREITIHKDALNSSLVEKIRFEPPSKIEVRESLIQGYGVFATKDFEQDEVVERCPSIDLPVNYEELPRCIQPYSFSDTGRPALVLGYGTLYNHSKKPNVYYKYINNGFVFSTLRPVKAGEELLLDYGPNYDYSLFESEVLELPEDVGELTKWPTEKSDEKDVLQISKSLNTDVVVIDNIYKNPDEVREFALSRNFKANDAYHKGQRTDKRYLTEDLKRVFERALDKKITKWKEHGINGVFQFCVAGDALVYHADAQSYAAMIYLTPNAPASCGTTLYKSKSTGLRRSPTKEDAERLGRSTGHLHYKIFKNNFYDKTDLEEVDVIGNVYNRLFIFNAQNIHAASEYFGNEKTNSRLFQIFFFDAE